MPSSSSFFVLDIGKSGGGGVSGGGGFASFLLAARPYLVAAAVILALELPFVLFFQPWRVAQVEPRIDAALQPEGGGLAGCKISAAQCRAEENYWVRTNGPQLNVQRRKDFNGGHFQPSDVTDAADMLIRILVPTYQCPGEERLGVWGDGGKWTCMLPSTIQPKPIVYSIGSNESFSFESEISAELHIRTDTFDPFIPPEAQARMKALPFLRFHSIGVASAADINEYKKWYPKMRFMRLGEIMKRLGHSYVDVLKLDCEGCEENFIRELVKANHNKMGALTIHGGRLPFGQMLCEFHRTDMPNRTLPLVYGMESLGYRMFHIEPNPQCLHCQEIAFIHDTLVKPSPTADCRPFLQSSSSGLAQLLDAQGKAQAARGTREEAAASGAAAVARCPASRALLPCPAQRYHAALPCAAPPRAALLPRVLRCCPYCPACHALPCSPHTTCATHVCSLRPARTRTAHARAAYTRSACTRAAYARPACTHTLLARALPTRALPARAPPTCALPARALPMRALPCCPRPAALQPARRPALQPALRPALQPARCTALLPSPAALVAASGGGQQQQCQPETLSSQELREWVARRGRSGPGAWDFMRAGGTGQRRQSRRQETLSPQQLREWVVRRGSPGGGGYRAGGTRQQRQQRLRRPSHRSSFASAVSVGALHTFTLDSGATRCFFRDCTVVTPLTTPVPVSLADPSGTPVVARASTVLPCPAAPSGSLTGFHLPSFSKNLVSNAVLQDQFVTVTTPRGELVAICTDSRTGEHLATFSRSPGSGLSTLTTESARVATSGQVAALGQLAVSCSCRLLSHQTLLWHHRRGHPSLPRLRGMHSRLLVSGLPRSLPPLPCSLAPSCLPYVEGRQRAAPHSSSFPPTTTPLQTLHMDVWGPARVRGQDQECYFLLVVDDYTRYTTVFPLRSKVDVREAVSLALRDFCRAEGIAQSFTLPASPLQNGIAERRIGLVIEVARTSMIHAAAPHFLWSFAVRYAAHQLNLWPRVSVLETSPTLRWTGEVSDASAYRVWGVLSLVRNTTASKLSPRTLRCVFLGFPTITLPWQFYHPASHRIISS
ncbi:unnamed protein product [Closterium sp. NIES-54]